MTKKKKKIHVHAPTLSGGQWVVNITEGRSPLAEPIESIPCGDSQTAAWGVYRQVQKDRGIML